MSSYSFNWCHPSQKLLLTSYGEMDKAGRAVWRFVFRIVLFGWTFSFNLANYG